MKKASFLFALLCTFMTCAEEFDLGNFKANESKTHIFKITNDSKTVLQLGKIRSSCGCTDAAYAKAFLQPGESTDFVVTLKANSLSGAFAKNIYVETNNAKQKFLRFVLRGTAVPLVTITPEPILFIGTLVPDKNYEYQFLLIPVKEPVVLELAGKMFVDGVTVQLDKSEKNWIATVKVSTSKIRSDVKINFFVKVKQPEGWPDMEFVINGKIQNIPAGLPEPEKKAP